MELHDEQAGKGLVKKPLSPGEGVCWLFIIAAASAIIWAGSVAKSRIEEKADEVVIPLLAAQAKVLTGANRIAPGIIAGEIESLDKFAFDPSTARAVAAINIIISDGDPAVLHRARRILGEHEPLETDDDGLRLHAAVLTAADEPHRLSEEQTRQLVAELGWIGKALYVCAKPESDPERQEIIKQGKTAVTAYFTLLGFAVVGVAAGLVITILSALTHFRKRPVLRPAGPIEQSRIYLGGFALYITLLFLLSVMPGLLNFGGLATALGGLAIASAAGLLFPLFRGGRSKTVLRGLGLHRGTGFMREIGLGLVGYIGIMPLLAVGLMLTIGLTWAYDTIIPPDPYGPPRLVGHPAAGWMAEGASGMKILVIFLAAGFAPFFEEAMFRGSLHAALRSRFGRLSSILIGAALFGAIHPQGPLFIPVLGSLAVGFGCLREWRDSLIAPITAHAVHNCILVVFLWILFA